MAASSEQTSPLLSVEGVSVDLPPHPAMGDACTVELHCSQMDLVSGSLRVSLPFSTIKAIELHQPIFGANYITGEYIRQGRTCPLTLTFKKGGAIDFTRLFFRLAQGELQPSHPNTLATSSRDVEIPQESITEDKKNR